MSEPGGCINATYSETEIQNFDLLSLIFVYSFPLTEQFPISSLPDYLNQPENRHLHEPMRGLLDEVKQ